MFLGLFPTGNFPGNSIKVILGKFIPIPRNSGKLKYEKCINLGANFGSVCNSFWPFLPQIDSFCSTFAAAKYF